LITNK